MTSQFITMLIARLALLHAVACFDLQIQGVVDFDLHVPRDGASQNQQFRVDLDVDQGKNLVVKMVQAPPNEIVKEEDCSYQYPEMVHVDILLSNIMNELTKIFVRTNEFITTDESSRTKLKPQHPQGRWKLETNLPIGKNESAKGGSRRKGVSRFIVVNQRQKEFFEVIFANMTDKFRTFYNETLARVERADACKHQHEVRQMWSDLLEQAYLLLRGAARQCIEEQFQEQQVLRASEVRSRVREYLDGELDKLRMRHLNLLCDLHKLCYHDLVI